LATAKELLAAGHSAVCFERAPSLGGVFRLGETGGVVWESCRLTSSALLTAFSDFPMAGAEAHPPVGEYVAYLTRYAEHFQVLPHIRFDTTVESLAQNPAGNWTLRIRQGAQCSEETFDAVAVCSGLHQHPHVPKFAGQESFHGQIMHAADYRRPAQVRGKKVLIIGAGESGADVAAEVAANAAETVLSQRCGVAVVPRSQFGAKTDDFVRAIAQGRCKRAPGVDRFDGARAVFTDGSEFTPDLVILCTGFETRVPLLSDSIVNTPRFLHTFHPEIGTILGFIGFVRPAFGAIPPLAEPQRSIDYWTKFRAHFFRAVRGRLDHLVEFTCFRDELASRSGCKPAWRDLRKESRAFRRRFIAAQHRLAGPHAKPELARGIIEDLSILHPWPDRWNLHLRWFLSRTLDKLRGPEFAPKLEIEA
jgi:hypothetical protein